VATGQVKFYDAKKGFGFLSPDGGGADLFVAKTVLAAGMDGLSPGQRVEFDAATGQRGLYARSVRTLSAKTVDPSTPAALALLSPRELDTLITDLIAALDATVLPELRQGNYPATTTPALAMVRALAGHLDSCVTASERQSSPASARSARSTRRGRTPTR
jgi:cold shock protein